MIHFITPNLAIGNASDAHNSNNEMTNLGITACLNVAFDLDIPNKDWRQMQRAKVGLIDGPGNDYATMTAALITLAGLMTKYDKVMIHCHEGKSRSPTIAALYIALQNGLELDAVLATIVGIRDLVDPKPKLLEMARWTHKVLSVGDTWKMTSTGIVAQEQNNEQVTFNG